MTIPYFQETGLTTIPGAAFLEALVLVLFLEALLLVVAETEDAATTLVETKALLVPIEEEAEVLLAILY